MSTTKKLYLIRHSKADFPSEGISDLERPLTSQGVSDSHHVAQKLIVAGVKPDIVIASHAFRAINTAIIFSDELGFPFSGIVLNNDLYESKVRDYLDVVNLISDEVKTALLIGHNETISEFSAYITGQIAEFPTSGVAEILFNGEWSEISAGTADLVKQFFA